eukprot:Gb_01197 [translate_table: standard]
MSQSLDPFEVAFNESETPPESPIASPTTTAAPEEETLKDPKMKGTSPANSDDERAAQPLLAASAAGGKAKDEEEEEEENMEVELGKYQAVDPDKMAKMHSFPRKRHGILKSKVVYPIQQGITSFQSTIAVMPYSRSNVLYLDGSFGCYEADGFVVNTIV